MRLHLWGTDFRRSSPEIRTKLYVPMEDRGAFHSRLLEMGFQDMVYLATCNRVEFYTTAPDYFRGTRSQWLKVLGMFGLGEDAYYRGYHLEGKSALRHLLRVGASLESLVVGESQILGQLKDALKWTQEARLPIHSSLERAFGLCFQTAKRVRTETPIGEKPVSVATLGLQHLQSAEADFPLKRAVVVGRSPISLLIVQWLQRHRPECPIIWVNRSLGALAGIPESAGTELVALSEFLQSPPDFSHFFTSTASPVPLFDSAFFARLSDDGKLFFDFAQPPDIVLCPELDRRGRIVHMEDLVREARENSHAREKAVESAEEIIDDALRAFCREQKETPLLKEFGDVESRVHDGVADALTLLEKDLPEEWHPRVKKWAEKLVRRHWHQSREHLKDILHRVTEPMEH